MTTSPVARTTRARRIRARSVTALALACVLALAGCTSGGDGGDGGEASGSGSASSGSAEPTPYLPVGDGPELTPEGSALAFGDTATVAYRPTQGKVGVVDLTVTKVIRSRISDLAAFKLDKKAKKATPYYVHARVKNVGATKVGGSLPPLYVEDAKNRLVQASQFKSEFKRCPSTALPKKLGKGKKTTACWVYLVDGGKAEGVSFYSVKTMVPVTWTGQFSKPGGSKTSAKGNG